MLTGPCRSLYFGWYGWFCIVCTGWIPWVCLCYSVTESCLTAIPWNAACQALLSFTISMSLIKVMSIEPAMLSNLSILCYPLLLLPSILPSIRGFSSKSAFLSFFLFFFLSQLFISGGQSTGASASVLPRALSKHLQCATACST